MDERPPISPSKLLHQFNDWIAETEMPGRTMAYLKTGMLHEVLADDGGEAALAMLDVWQKWEKGKVGPLDTLQALRDEGLIDVLTSLSA